MRYYNTLIACLCIATIQFTFAQSGKSFTTFNGVVNSALKVTPAGAANYSIELVIPPGTNGVEPQLSIDYSSQAGNGLAGVGFSLQGISAITRVGATHSQDGFRGGINYDVNDRFNSNENRLITTGNSSYTDTGATYYTELNDWSKTIASGTSGSGPSSFSVYQKNGVIAQYGTSTDSRVLAQGIKFDNGPLAGSVRTWLINSITDPNGNGIQYTYTTTPKSKQGIPITEAANDGTAYPDVIYYTTTSNGTYNRKVQFFYEPRADTLLQFAGGAAFRISVRLKAIQTSVFNGTDTLPGLSYLLNYDSCSPLQVSRLSSVTKISNYGVATQPVSFL